MSDFLSRVHDARIRYEHATGGHAAQLFLGPKEYWELKEMCAQYPASLAVPCSGPEECFGMTTIGLASDGLRVGRRWSEKF